MQLSLALIRAHLNLDDDRDEELLTHYANVAEEWVEAYTGERFNPYSALMVQAALMLIGQHYDAREAISFSNPYTLPFGIHEMLSPLKYREV
ncbi:head-tail connector protein [Fuscibacter oryzae]|uniref:Phage gp6-like head-tail connector protein n=1 Tax=Fuscibacter oryzae TaxID=2803939 RepID=A0A8J7MQH7_9RHOB|nr:head-tail connector protein [Fuscibacter oryzae]MBL4928001.1 phage gp6-like head-tail connector protein [Fuscibacter oryzae]